MTQLSREEKQFSNMGIVELSIHTIRTLSMDAVQKANSGHPGTPMALAPLAYELWMNHLRCNPRNPNWFDRDRFVLSCGHASMLLYAVLHLTGYELALDEIVRFRQWGSKTPGHPEYGLTPGVETTTGPLGQGFMNAVGMAMAEAHLASVFNRQDHMIVDHHTYVFMSDGDIMEGASHEAASLAGHLGLGKLICVYDDNRITIDGETSLSYSDDVVKRFEGYNWHVQDLGDSAEDLSSISGALNLAKAETERPSLLVVRSHIGYGSPRYQDTARAHGAPLGDEEIEATKRNYGWPEGETFLVPDKVSAHMGEAVSRGVALEEDWNRRFAKYQSENPELAVKFQEALEGKPPSGWESGIPRFDADGGALATRAASGKVLNEIASAIPWLVGGSADLAASNNSLLKESGNFARGDYANRNIHWGIREHAMGAACSGMALHGGVRPYAATFFTFTDYARPAIRLAALMELPVIYLMTHDSIGLGEDGPTHQPIEHLASLRAMPGLTIIRPCDANETAAAWRVAIERSEGPTMLVLTRQGLPVVERSEENEADALARGAYVISPERGNSPQAILIATGSEVELAMEAKNALAADGIDARVVSMPSWELFREQPRSYRVSVLPAQVKARVAIEAGATMGWREWVGDHGVIIGLDHFGASAPYKEIYAHFGLTSENIVEQTKGILGS